MTLESWERLPGFGSAIRWGLSRPFRTFARARLPRGRGFFGRMALLMAWRTVAPKSVITAATPGGSSVAFNADTLIGRILWTEGGFERVELEAAFSLATPGTFAFDVGANVGLFTVVMSRAVGPTGRVIAIEPVAGTTRDLRQNLARNKCANVDVIEGAAAAAPGDVALLLTDDPALHTAGGEPIAGHPALQVSTTRAHTLDDLWRSAGSPDVSLVKVDVEGAERQVLLGAAEMIECCRPAVIVEVNGAQPAARAADLLRGYHIVPTRGFESWNHLLMPQQAPTESIEQINPTLGR
jgi:FkbM family methyltransferase